MAGANERPDPLKRRTGGGDDLFAHHGVLLHELPLLAAERSRLGDDLIGNPELADVVQVAGLDDEIDRLRLESHRAREQLHVTGHVIGMPAQVGVALGQSRVKDRRDELGRPLLVADLLAIHVLVGETQGLRSARWLHAGSQPRRPKR